MSSQKDDEQREESAQSKAPLLFVSHRHTDVRVANVLKDWIASQARGEVEVFQSSAVGTGPTIGRNLNSELLEKLDVAEVVILLYTAEDQNWSYCMWESGVALNPSKPDTNIIVFQCGNSVPKPFQDRVRVNVRDKVSVQNFASDFLTDPDFFPRRGEALAPRLDPSSEQVLGVGEELFETLAEALPSLAPEPSEEWPAVGYVTLEIGLDSVEKIEEAPTEERAEVTKEEMQAACLIQEGDYVAARIIGMANLQEGLPFSHALDIWKESRGDTSDAWIDEVVRQVALAACWRFPGVEWKLFRGANEDWYAPLIHWIRRKPGEGTMQFDLHFLPIPSTGIPAVETEN